jgi:hypothetical protein
MICGGRRILIEVRGYDYACVWISMKGLERAIPCYPVVSTWQKKEKRIILDEDKHSRFPQAP